jgi:hypothetical protein
MAAHQLIGRCTLVAVTAVVLGVSGCGGGDDNPAFSDNVRQEMDAKSASRRAKVERLVDEGKLPPVALRVLHADGTLNVNFIDGPNNDRDVVRSSSDGTSGKKLAWDLDQDGKISADERTITERDLYDATLGAN